MTGLEIITQYGEDVVKRCEEIIEAINNGSKFNGKVYIARTGQVNVYIDGNYKLLDQNKGNQEDIKKGFLLMLKESKQVQGDIKKVDYSTPYTQNWWASGMNGE